jgi:hypothetical protein
MNRAKQIRIERNLGVVDVVKGAQISHRSLKKVENTALRGADGSDNDVLFELRRLNARRWGWGEALRVDHRTVVQVIRFRRRNGDLFLAYYTCQWRGSAVADWRFVPYR